MKMNRSLRTLATLLSSSAVIAFSPSAPPVLRLGTQLFQTGTSVASIEAPVPVNPLENLNIDLPDFSELFDKIQQVSPLARSVVGENDDAQDESLKWKRVESNKNGVVNQIDKLDKFNGISTPLFRFRARVKGPCIGEFFGRFILDVNERRKWDAQIDHVDEIHSIEDLNAANQVIGAGFGECARMGLGHGRTKPAFGITPREQMFLYGLQNFDDGSSLIWGTDLGEEYNHLLPSGPRHTRAKSHLFSATLKPAEDGAFDIEYILQLEIGGSMPTWLTNPVLIDTVKSLFQTAKDEFEGATDSLHRFLQEKARDTTLLANSLLVPH